MGEHLRTASVFVSYPEVVAQYGCKPNGGFCNLKATGARVNLTAANVILLCDPWWTPGAEAQAQLCLLDAAREVTDVLPRHSLTAKTR